MERVNFTKSWISNLPFEVAEYQDELVPQLHLRVGRRAKTFSLVRFRATDNRYFRVHVGDASRMNPIIARDEARRLAGLIGKGLDPRAPKPLPANAITLQRVWGDFQKSRALKPNTLRGYKQIVDSPLADLMSTRMSHLTWTTVRDLHRELGSKSGEQYANAVMRLLRSMVNFARAEYLNEDGDPIFTDNPVARLSLTKAWYKNKRRKTYIRKQDLQAWLQAVYKLDNEVHRDYLLVCLLSGLRRSEATSLRPEHVDLMDQSFLIPDTKNDEGHRLPMGPELRKIFNRRVEACKGDWLFPGRKEGMPLNDPRKSMAKITKVSGVPFVMHDLRRTFTTIAESLELSSYVIKRLLNHEMSGDVTAGYIVPNVERLRGPMTRIESTILSWLSPPEAHQDNQQSETPPDTGSDPRLHTSQSASPSVSPSSLATSIQPSASTRVGSG